MSRDLLIHLRAAFEHYEWLPFAGWVKDTKGMLVSVNASYEDMVGLGSESLVGEKDGVEKSHGARRSDEFAARDQRVVKEGKVITWPDDLGVVVKWPIKHEGDVVAVAGLVIPLEALPELIEASQAALAAQRPC